MSTTTDKRPITHEEINVIVEGLRVLLTTGLTLWLILKRKKTDPVG